MLIIVVPFIPLANLKQITYQKVLCLTIVGIHIKNTLVFSLFKTLFFFTFLFSIYKMVDIMYIYKYLNISFQTIMNNPEILRFVSNHLKTKKCVSMQLKYFLIC